jgi:integrase
MSNIQASKVTPDSMLGIERRQSPNPFKSEVTTMSDSTPKAVQCKPQKPTEAYPLYPHASGRWAKKIKGKTLFFGKWDDPADALAKYEAFISTDAGVKPDQLTPGVKPAKPYQSFPLYPHATKRWAKKIKGKTYFFGPWGDWKRALEEYQRAVPFLQLGKPVPPKDSDALSVADLVNTFLEHRDAQVKSGELSQRHFGDLKRTGAFLIECLGRNTNVELLTPQDFADLRSRIAKKGSLIYVANEVQRCRTMFNFAYKNQMIDRPVKMGLSFAKPTKQALRKERQAQPQKAYSIEELTTLYREAGPQMRCFMLLALNAGFGNADIGQLENRHVIDGWIRFPRPKTSVERDCPLWPETLAAISVTRQTKHDSPLVFLTKYGKPWHKDSPDSPITKEFSKLLKQCGLQVAGRGFYSLRHTFRTVADSSLDRVAIDRIMGHTDTSMGGIYREWIDPERLHTVVNHVRTWAMPMLRGVS